MKKLAFPLTILVIVVSIALYYYNGEGSSTIRGQESDFAVKDTASITKIFLSDKADNTILLERNDMRGWRLINQYIARPDAIDNLLETMYRISVKAPVPKSSFEGVVKNIAGQNTKVEIYQGTDTPSKVYFVGGPNKAHSGTYMLMENASVPFLIHIEGFHGFVSPRYFINENEWRNNFVFEYQYGSIASVRVEYPAAPVNSFKLTVSEDDKVRLFNLPAEKEIEVFDEMLAKQFVTQFKKVPFESFEETRATAYLDSLIRSGLPQAIYTVTDRAGKAKEVKTYLKPLGEGGKDLEGNPIDIDLDRLYAVIDNAEIVVIQYIIFDKLKLSINHLTPQPVVGN